MVAFLIAQLPSHQMSLEVVELMQKNNFFYRISTNIPLMNYAMSCGAGENHQLKAAMGLSVEADLGTEELRLINQLTDIFPSEIKIEAESWPSNENFAPKECSVKVENDISTVHRSNLEMNPVAAQSLQPLEIPTVTPNPSMNAERTVNHDDEEVPVNIELSTAKQRVRAVQDEPVLQEDDQRMEIEDSHATLDALLEPPCTDDSTLSRDSFLSDELEEDLLEHGAMDSKKRLDEDMEKEEEEELIEEQEHEDQHSDDGESWEEEEEDSDEEDVEEDAEVDSDKGHRTQDYQKNEDDEWEEEEGDSDEEEEKDSDEDQEKGHGARNSEMKKWGKSGDPTERLLFACPVKDCNSSYSIFEKLTEHVEHHPGKLEFFCDACKKEFPSKTDAMAHIQERQKKACCSCGRKFTLSSSLTRHLRTAVSNQDEEGRCSRRSFITLGRLLFTCPVKNCPDSFKNFKQLEDHITVHSGKQEFFCDVCKKNFSLKALAMTHISQRETLKCCNCEVKSTTKSNMVMHLRSHTGEKPFVCKTCGKDYAHGHHLKGHMKSHTGEKSYSCRFCEKSFALKHHLDTHERTHTGEKPFKCSHCDYRSSEGNHLKTHMRTHTGEKPYSCSYCEKRFATTSHLKIHERIHTGEKPFECTQCGHRFSDKSDLTRHMRIHTGEKPYACKKCEKKFARSGDLKMHIRNVHTGEKPYSCEKCGKKFAQKGNLKEHARRMHKS